MNFLYNLRGDVQALKAPLSYDKDWLGSFLFSLFPSTMRFQERNFFLNNAQSETKTIKTTLSFGSLLTRSMRMERKKDLTLLFFFQK